MAAAVIVSIVAREPNRPISNPPPIAPATPPRLNTVIPVLATVAPSPAPLRIEGSQLNPR